MGPVTATARRGGRGWEEGRGGDMDGSSAVGFDAQRASTRACVSADSFSFCQHLTMPAPFLLPCRAKRESLSGRPAEPQRVVMGFAL